MHTKFFDVIMFVSQNLVEKLINITLYLKLVYIEFAEEVVIKYFFRIIFIHILHYMV